MRVVQHTVDVPGASAEELYRMLMVPELHAELTNAPARIESEPGGRFSLFDGAVTGTVLLAVPDRLTVKTWRGSVWQEDDPDSIEIMRFSDTEDGARIELVHALVPDQFVERWNELYWSPLRARFAARAPA
jgi:activator of HSP90 ATPase